MISNAKKIIPAQKKIKDISDRKIINNEEKNKNSSEKEKEVKLNTFEKIFQFGNLKLSKFNLDLDIEKDPRYLDDQIRRNLILIYRIMYLESQRKFDLSLCIKIWRAKSLYIQFFSSMKTEKNFFEEFSKILSFNSSDNNEADMLKFIKKFALKKLLPIKRRNNILDLKYYLYKWKCNSRIIKSDQEKKLILKLMSLYSFFHNEINNKKILSQFLEKWRIISKFQSSKENHYSIRKEYIKLNSKCYEPKRKSRNNDLKIQILKANEKNQKINELILYKRLKKWEKNSLLMKISEEKEENNKKILLKNILKNKSKKDKIEIITKTFNKWRFHLNEENKGNIDKSQNSIDKVFARDIFSSCYASNYIEDIYHRKINLNRNFKFIENNGKLMNKIDLNINFKRINEEEEKINDNFLLDEIKNHLDENIFYFDNNIPKNNKYINFAKGKFEDVKLYNYEIPKNMNINSEKFDMKVYFNSVNIEGIKNFPIYCKKSDIFFTLEKKLYAEFPEFQEFNSKCFVNSKEIYKFKTIEENNIKNNDIIEIYIIN